MPTRPRAVRPAGPGSIPPAAPRGFTLLEVMIVVGMAAMVMAISIPFVQRSIRRDAIYQAVHVVEDACHNARSLAIFHNATSELVIRPQDKAFTVRPGSNPHRPPARAPDDTEDTDGPPPPKSSGFGGLASKPYSGTLSEDTAIELLDVNFVPYRDEDEARVRFHPNGTSDEFTIVLRVGTSAWRKISLDIVTGLPVLEVIR